MRTKATGWVPGHTSKAIEWSYPSSPNAVRFGFAKSGCYTVTLRSFANDIGNPAYGFNTILEAQSYADSLPFGWHHLTLNADAAFDSYHNPHAKPGID